MACQDHLAPDALMTLLYCLDASPGLCLSAEAWASWAQATVSILAIAAGAVVISWQVGRQERRDARRRLAEEVRRLSNIASGIFHCRALCEQMRAKSEIGAPIEHQISAVELHAALLHAIPALEIPDWAASYAIARVHLTALGLRAQLIEHPGIDRAKESIHKWRVPFLNAMSTNSGEPSWSVAPTFRCSRPHAMKRGRFHSA